MSDLESELKLDNVPLELKITFNPYLIEPLLINPLRISENIEQIIAKLKEFDRAQNEIWEFTKKPMWHAIEESTNPSIRNLMYDTIYESGWNLRFDSMWDAMRDLIFFSMRGMMWDSIQNSVKFSMNDLMRDSADDFMKYSMGYSVPDLINHSMRDSVLNSMHVSVWASIMQKLPQKAYEEELLKDGSVLKDYPYEKIKKLCDLYCWFSEHGVFPHRGTERNTYLLTSWKYPKTNCIVDITACS